MTKTWDELQKLGWLIGDQFDLAPVGTCVTSFDGDEFYWRKVATNAWWLYEVNEEFKYVKTRNTRSAMKTTSSRKIIPDPRFRVGMTIQTEIDYREAPIGTCIETRSPYRNWYWRKVDTFDWVLPDGSKTNYRHFWNGIYGWETRKIIAPPSVAVDFLKVDFLETSIKSRG